VSEFENLAERLDAVAADLDDLAFDQLREAVADGEIERPRSDKRMMQARRAVEKASHLLRQLAENPDGDRVGDTDG